MASALQGLRVLDLSVGPVAGMATMILADFGAEVLKLTGPGGDPFASLPAAPLWQRGKKQLQIDISAESEAFEQLCAGADVLVCNWRPSALRRHGLDWEELSQRHPHLTLCHITGFGSEGPRAEIPGYEHLAAAAIGRMQVFAGIVDRPGPVFSALQVGTHACAQSAVTGILAALHQQKTTGHGQLVETSLLQGLIAYEQGAMLGAQFRELFPDMFPTMQPTSHEPPLPSLYYHPAQAGDGRWVQFGNLLPHLFDNFLIVTGLVDIIADPDFNAAQMRLPEEKHEAFRDRMLARVQERSADDWMQDFIADGGVVATTYQTTQQALQDPDIVANGHVIAREDGGVELGPVARMTRTPANPGTAVAPDTELATAWRSSPRPTPTGDASDELPLQGLKVIEIATIIAAPLSASFLSDMGAEVIKVEQIGGDPYRGLGAGIGSARVNAGKRSISVNLKSEAGRELVLKLLKDADVMIHNYRPGVPERLGIGYDQISAINPDIVYLQANGYGPDGPGAQRPSTHPIPGAAMGGVMYQMGERVPADLQDNEGLRLWTKRLMKANEVNPDPNTALVITSAVMLGLAARDRNGFGQRVMVDMFGANAYANADDFLSYPDKPGRPMPDEKLLGLSPLYRLYACAENSWIFLAIPTEREQQRFIQCLNTNDISPPDIPQLAAADNTTADFLGTLFQQKTAADWESLLTADGVGCVQADRCMPSEFYLTDDQARQLNLTAEVQHPSWGQYRRHGSLVRFNRLVKPMVAPPLAGQHNQDVLSEYGYNQESIDQMTAAGVLWQDNNQE